MNNELPNHEEFCVALATRGSRSTKAWRMRCIIFILLTGCGSCSSLIDDLNPPSVENAATAEALNVNVVRVRLSQNVVRDHACFGTLTPRRSSSLGFARGGRVAEVLFDVGGKASAGEKIAALEQGQLDNQAAQLKQQIKRANTSLTTLERSVRSEANQRQIAQLQRNIASLEADLKAVELELANGMITAPYDGIIAERQITVGDSVAVGRPAFKFVDGGRPIVELRLATGIAAQIAVGQAALVEIDESTMQAEVFAKSPELDTMSRTQAVTLELVDDAAVRTWTLGEAVEVHFKLPTEMSGFWLPNAALQGESNGLWSGMAVVGEDNRQVVQRRTLEVLYLQGDYALVRGSLNDGDRVIVNGLNRVVAGQAVVSQDVTSQFSASEQGGGE